MNGELFCNTNAIDEHASERERCGRSAEIRKRCCVPKDFRKWESCEAGSYLYAVLAIKPSWKYFFWVPGTCRDQ